jgi:hypothetical protein
MILEEVEKLIKQISLNERILDILQVKIFYLSNKRENTEVEENENKLTIIKILHQIELHKAKLHFLNSEFKLNFEMLKIS